MENSSSLPLAIVGLGAILPDAPGVAVFWDNIQHGRSAISEVPVGRWDPAFYYDPDPRAPDKTYSKIGGWVHHADWDPPKWRLPIPPRVANAMDGSQRWAIACTVQALADYGFPARPLDVERTAVILGNAMGGEQHYKTTLRVSFPEFAAKLAETPSFAGLPPKERQKIVEEWHRGLGSALPEITEDSMPGELSNCIAGRLANLFNFRGANYVVDAACASAMAAISAAAKGLTEHEFDVAITGGVDRNMGASSFIKFSKIGALSATGSRPYAEGADGFVMGEGCVLFLLKRLEDAERAGDRIYAVLLGIGASSDGKGKGITAPNPIGQRLAIGRAWANAGISPESIGLIEGHGTSTAVGDVVEVESLAQTLGAAGLRTGSVALGSVKSNIGHLKAAAGAAGLLKVVLALHHKVLPPSINFERPNHNIDFNSSPFYVNTESREWTRANGTPRRACASAFGFGGTNFHCVLEEYVPGNGNGNRKAQLSVNVPEPNVHTATGTSAALGVSAPLGASTLKPPLRGALVLGAANVPELREKLATVRREAASGQAPALTPPAEADLRAPERIAIDYGSAIELADRAARALKALDTGTPATWKLLKTNGIFRGSGPRPKVAFLYPGQGSQYVNMLRQLRDREPIVAQTFAEADAIATPLIGKPLSEFLFVDGSDRAALDGAENALKQTSITQPAVLTVDLALTRLLAAYGIAPDMVMGHSLGEYGALQAAGALPFADAVEAVSARGREMTRVAVADKGKMAAVFAPITEIERILKQVDGDVVIANVNSQKQAVIGGATAAVERALPVFERAGYTAVPLSVSHAFHTSIVAAASAPLRAQLSRLRLAPPKVPIIANVTGGFYPTDGDVLERMLDLLAQQVAAPVQFVKGLHTLHEAGCRVFVEIGPKRALQGFVEDAFGDLPDVLSLFTNHPKSEDVTAFNQALCGLFAAGFGQGTPSALDAPALPIQVGDEERQARNVTEDDRVVITGAALGLPGTSQVFDDDNVGRMLRGTELIDLVPVRMRRAMVDKRITRLVKTDEGSPRFDIIDSQGAVIKLAARGGQLDLTEEFGVPADRVAALDSTSSLAIGAGLEALRDAGLPLVLHYKTTSKGTKLPDRWGLPESLRDETAVIFASAFPGCDAFASEMTRYHVDRGRREQIAALQSVRARLNGSSEAAREEVDRRISELQSAIDREPYTFDRRFLMRVLPMGHSQFAELIGARGPNTQVNAACASTTMAMSLAEDWIRLGRCRRVVIVSGDNVTSDNLLEWMGSGFLASGAAATDDVIEEAALPFDRRRHGLIVGMGAAAIVVESLSAAHERGLQPIGEVLGSITANSAYHGTRLNVTHISEVMESLVCRAEKRWGLDRREMAPQTVFVSHETYTPARGGSASAEVHALRHVFGEKAADIVVANTKGYTGHPMGAGIEDVTAIKSLETGLVPPVANFQEMDPELGPLNLSRGGHYPVQYALRLAAGFGSQISMSLVRWTPTPSGTRQRPDALGFDYRVIDRAEWRHWLERISGQSAPELEVVHRTLRVRDGVRAATAIEGERVTSTPTTVAAPAAIAAKPPVETRSVAEAPRPVTQPASAPPAPAVDVSVRDTIVKLVVEKTGYPADMLDLDLDLEADLGIDTVKQAELLAAIRGIYNIPRDTSLKLRDFPTLNHVIKFVIDRRPELTARPPEVTTVEAQSGAEVPRRAEAPRIDTPPAPSPAPARAPVPAVDTSVKDTIVKLVVEKTGYPADMLDLDLDLEADLGIDTVKQAELLAAIRGIYNIPRDTSLKLRDFPTLRHVIGFVIDRRPELTPAPPTPETRSGAEVPRRAEAPSNATVPVPVPATQAAAVDVSVRDTIVKLVVEKTGYPADMLDLDLDLEADLGIDTVKQAELLAAIRGIYNIPRDTALKLRDFPTLRHVIGFVMDRRPSAVTAPETQSGAEMPRRAEAPSNARVPKTPEPVSFDAADAVPRRVPVPVFRPAARICTPTGVTLQQGSRVVIAADAGGVATVLASRLAARGVDTLIVDTALDADAFTDRITEWASAGPVNGLFWLPALDAEGDLRALTAQTWRSALHVRVKLLYAATRALYDQLGGEGRFVVAATRLGGQHGYDDEGAFAPLGGAVTGFVKAFHLERTGTLVKAVDFSAEADAPFVAGCLIDETLRDPGVVEVGYKHDLRWSIGLATMPAPREASGPQLSRETVFVITGAAGSIVSAITRDLAAASGGRFYLLDRVPEPDPSNPDIARLTSDKDGLKQDIAGRLRARGEKATPALVERELGRLERADAALSAIQAISRAGGVARYLSVDLTDADSVARAVDVIGGEAGRIDVLVHAAGIDMSRFIPDKKPSEFDLVFDVKSDGWFNLLHAIGDLPLGATIAFSSIAARFGNAGQTDYAAANDLLCKIASSFRRTHPATRALAIDWTGWRHIGMASRGSIPKMLEQAGIELLPPDAGIPVVRRELTRASTSPEVVIALGLGVLEQRADAGGVDLEQALAAQGTPPGPMIGAITETADGVLMMETTLDPREQPFLNDHRISGIPVLPAVMGIEAFAEVAALAAPGWIIASVEDITFAAPFKFYKNQPRALKVEARFSTDGNDLVADCCLVGSRLLPGDEKPQETVHFTGRVRLARAPADLGVAGVPDRTEVAVESAGIYRVYFHGPAYQVLGKVWRTAEGLMGEVSNALPPNHVPADRPLIMSPRLIEACFQTAGLSEIESTGRMALPHTIRHISADQFVNAPIGPLYALNRPGAEKGTFDAVVVDSIGRVHVTLRGYSTTEVPDAIDEHLLHEVLPRFEPAVAR